MMKFLSLAPLALLLCFALSCGPNPQPGSQPDSATTTAPSVLFQAQPETVPAQAGKALLLDLSGRGPVPLEYGTWKSDKPDPRAAIRVEAGVAGPERQKGLRITYDISQEAEGARAFAGIWIKPSKPLDLTPWGRIVLIVRADQPGANFFVQLKSDHGRQSAQIAATGAAETWQRIAAPLSAFNGIQERAQVEEINISFDPTITKALSGNFELAEIRFE